MQWLIDLSGGWFLAVWWSLAIAALVVAAMLADWLRFPTSAEIDPEGEPATPYDLTELALPPRSSPTLVALTSLLHRRIVTLDDEGRLRKGLEPLPPDANDLESFYHQRATGVPVAEPFDAADVRARPGLRARLQSRGLLVLPSVDIVARLAIGCVFGLVLTLGVLWLLWSRATWDDSSLWLGLLCTSMALWAWLDIKVLRVKGKLTRRGRKAYLAAAAAHTLPPSMKGWPDSQLPTSQVEYAVALWGLDVMLRGAFPRLRAALAGSPIPPLGEASQAPTVPMDEALIQRLLGPTPAPRLQRIAGRYRWSLLAVALATATAGAAMTTSADPSSQGGRESPGFAAPEPVIGVGRYGYQAVLEPVPPVERGTRPADCDPEMARKAEQSVLGVLAEHERRHGPSLPPATPRTTEDDREHRAEDGEVYAVTSRSLHRIVLHDDDDRITTHELETIQAKLPVLGPERTMTPFVMHTTQLQALTFDPSGLLWALGDERLYVCSVDNGVCAPKGIVPRGTRAVAFLALHEGPGDLVAIGADGAMAGLQRVGMPSFLREAAEGLESRVELCTTPGPSYTGAPRILAGPVAGPDGRVYVVIEGPELTTLRVDDTSGFPAGLALPGPEAPVALVPRAERVLLFYASGSMLWADPSSGRLSAAQRTGHAWLAAAGYIAPRDERDDGRDAGSDRTASE